MINPTGQSSSISYTKKDQLRNLRQRVDITVRNLSELFSIPTFKRKWGIRVGVYDDGVNNGSYVLIRGESSNDIRDNDNWVKKDFFWKYYQDDTPDPNKASIKDIWFRPITANLFEIMVVDNNNYWVETTSPALKRHLLLIKAILTENSLYYWITEDEQYYIQQE